MLVNDPAFIIQVPIDTLSDALNGREGLLHQFLLLLPVEIDFVHGLLPIDGLAPWGALVDHEV